jgi:membrane-associated phospholipid phosphatase
MKLRLRSSEWIIIGYFCCAALAATLSLRTWKGWLVAIIIAGLVWALSTTQSLARDCVPVVWTYVAYREMNWFAPLTRDYHLEKTWIVWDRWLLDGLHLRAAIESAGILLPAYFEMCYALVYLVTPISLAAIIYYGRRDRVNQFWLAYLAGTLGTYLLFPYFLSEPPRTVFAGQDLPHAVTAIRSFNLWIAQNYGIHSSVFPSAHVAAALSAAWGLLITLPQRKRLGLSMAVYGSSVALGALYGRYHYLADVVSGIAMSFVGLAAALIFEPRKAFQPAAVSRNVDSERAPRGAGISPTLPERGRTRS